MLVGAWSSDEDDRSRLRLDSRLLLAVLAGLRPTGIVPFVRAQVAATVVAMVSNFLLNNELTYRDRRLKGFALIKGFVLFCGLCSVGVLANVDLASWLYVERPIWWVAGAIGAAMSVLWNYAMSTLFVWRAR